MTYREDVHWYRFSRMSSHVLHGAKPRLPAARTLLNQPQNSREQKLTPLGQFSSKRCQDTTRVHMHQSETSIERRQRRRIITVRSIDNLNTPVIICIAWEGRASVSRHFVAFLVICNRRSMVMTMQFRF